MGRRRRGAREGKKDMKQQLVRVALAAPRVHIAAPEKNVDEMLRLLRGCLDAQVLLPAANVQAGDVYWPQLGEFTLEVL